MKEFIEKLIGMLEEEVKSTREMQTIQCKGNDGYGTPLQAKLSGEICALLKAKNIVNQLAKEHEHCIKSSCTNCEVYDKEKHYCPKWCEVIRHTTSELAEKYDNGWIPCSERLPEESDYYMACIYNSDVDGFDFRKTWFAHSNDYDTEESEWRELYDFEVVTAWQPLPAPYQPKGE